jgi:predicted MPP superfamily phosphohydrolase
MSSTYGTTAPGNHERLSRLGTGFLERAGIRLLRDEVMPIDGAIVLAGRKDARSNDRKPVDELLAAAPRDLPVILIAHRPTGFDEARAAGADIQLSGPTTARSSRLTSSRPAIDLSWHLERGGAHLFVTSGVQGWGPPVRTVGASEILVIHLVLKGGD